MGRIATDISDDDLHMLPTEDFLRELRRRCKHLVQLQHQHKKLIEENTAMRKGFLSLLEDSDNDLDISENLKTLVASFDVERSPA